jgi:DNA replication and repair protein RecF
MKIRHVEIAGFRAHSQTTIDFDGDLTVLFGPNGLGKTNVLEAVHYACLTKDFLPVTDGIVLKKNASMFEVIGRFEADGRAQRTRVAFVQGVGKKVFLNGSPVKRLTDLVGRFPVVAYAPQDYALTSGGPAERRRFLDNVLSQAKPAYLSDLLAYRRALRQRNALLGHRRADSRRELQSWTEEYVRLGSRVVFRRAEFVRDFVAYISRAYDSMHAVDETPSVTYSTVAPDRSRGNKSDIEAHFFQETERKREAEIDQGRTLVGPHRDEVIFRLNGLPVRSYASQGQHRMFALAVRIAQHWYLADILGETPILLLDDVMDNFDRVRAGAFLEFLRTNVAGQKVITTANPAMFADVNGEDLLELSHFMTTAPNTSQEESAEVTSARMPGV